MVTVLVGTNWYSLKHALDERVDQFVDQFGSLSIVKINAAEVSIGRILAPMHEQSLFSSGKLVILHELSANKAAAERVEHIIDLAQDPIQLIIVETKPDKRSSYYKTLKKTADFHEYNELTEPELIRWALRFAESLGGQMSSQAAQYLVERVNMNQSSLEKELIKLSLFDKNITVENIDLLTDASPRSTIFNLVEAAFAGNVDRALRIYDDQRAQRVEPQAILGMLVWQMHLVAVCVAGGAKTSNEIAQETGLSSYSLGKAKEISRRIGVQKTRSTLNLLKQIEATSKKQTYDLDDALKYVIQSLDARTTSF